MDLAAAHRSVAIDFGTGDGAYAQRLAASDPRRLVIGVDANGDNLAEISRRAAAKLARGGLPNARFGRLALTEAPGTLAGLADELTVLLPWGELLQTVALGQRDPLERLRGLCKPGAAVHVVFGYGASSERAAIASLGLPAPGALSLEVLRGRYHAAGFSLRGRELAIAEVAALPTTWAKKLAFSGRARRFWELRGTAETGKTP